MPTGSTCRYPINHTISPRLQGIDWTDRARLGATRNPGHSISPNNREFHAPSWGSSSHLNSILLLTHHIVSRVPPMSREGGATHLRVARGFVPRTHTRGVLKIALPSHERRLRVSTAAATGHGQVRRVKQWVGCRYVFHCNDSRISRSTLTWGPREQPLSERSVSE